MLGDSSFNSWMTLPVSRNYVPHCRESPSWQLFPRARYQQEAGRCPSLGRRHANSNSVQSVNDAAQPSKAAPLNLTEERLPKWAMRLSRQPRYGARRRSKI